MVNLTELVQATSMVSIAADSIKESVDEVYRAMLAANGENHSHSKMHWLCHFDAHQQKLCLLPSCYVHERKVKKFCSNTFNTCTYEFSLLKELCAEDLHGLQEDGAFWTYARLQHRSPPTKKVLHLLQDHLAFSELFTCCVACLSPAGTAKKGDMVLFGSMSAGKVVLHIEVDKEVLTLVSICSFQGYDVGTCSGKWQMSDEHFFVYTSSIKCALVYKELPNGTIVGLVPLAFRPKWPRRKSIEESIWTVGMACILLSLLAALTLPFGVLFF